MRGRLAPDENQGVVGATGCAESAADAERLLDNRRAIRDGHGTDRAALFRADAARVARAGIHLGHESAGSVNERIAKGSGRAQ